MSKDLQIAAYITADENRVIGGDFLILLIKDKEKQKETCVEIARTLRTDVVELKNGDYMLIKQ